MERNNLPIVITGYCIVFNTPSVVIKNYGRTFREVMHKEAFTEQFLRDSDVYLTLYHNDERILAHHTPGNGGNLSLAVDDHGVKFRVQYSSFDEFEDLRTAVALMRNGVLNKCSFVYTLANEGDSSAVRYEDQPDGIQLRHIYRIDELRQICIARKPAYETTVCRVEQSIRRSDY